MACEFRHAILVRNPQAPSIQLAFLGCTNTSRRKLEKGFLE
jgi:hypothetical protein